LAQPKFRKGSGFLDEKGDHEIIKDAKVAKGKGSHPNSFISDDTK